MFCSRLALSLPQVVTFGNGATITYYYAADGTKVRTVHVINGATTQTDYCGNVIYENGAQKLLQTEEGYVDLANSSTYHYYLKDHQGNNRVVINSSGTVKETNHYYPFGGLFAGTSVQPFKYNGKEFDSKNGLNWYDYGARHYDATLGRFTTVDPLAEESYGISPYAYCLNSPVKYVDPTGESTWVMQNADGTYRVVGGDLEDKDRNIYVYRIQDGQLVRGESIGVTTSITSFYNSDAKNREGAWAIGSTIDPNNQSGKIFLSEIIRNNPAMLDDYAINARNGHKYDFKETNGTNEKITDVKGFYRGMPIGKNANGQIVYTSARDIGNIAAGYVAGSNGMPWWASRIAFDLYQGSTEGVSTQNAEYYGWRMGYNLSPNRKLSNFKKSMKSLFNKLW